MKSKSIKVNCSFCGKEIECPENMKSAEKHACFECFKNLGKNLPKEELGKIYVDIPVDKVDEIISEMSVSWMMEEVFPQLWEDKKSELKEMSKRELAEEMFLAGASIMSEHIIQMTKEGKKEKLLRRL